MLSMASQEILFHTQSRESYEIMFFSSIKFGTIIKEVQEIQTGNQTMVG